MSDFNSHFLTKKYVLTKTQNLKYFRVYLKIFSMGKKLKKYKVGLDSETMAISLVSEPAIEVDFVHMSKDEERKPLFFEKDEKYMVYGPVLIPDIDIYRNNGEQEYYLSFTKESIEKMSQEYMKDFKQYNVNLQHEEQVDEVCMVESWIVMDAYKDKANALGFNVPVGTWMTAFKVNNIDTWNRIKDGELKGFSVESMISLEEFSKNENNMNRETNEMFWDKLKNILKDAFSKKEELAANSGFSSVEDYEKEVEAIKEELAEETPAEPVAEPQINPTVEPQEPQTEPEPTPVKVEENNEPEPKPVEPKVEEPKPQDNHLEELINSLKDEIAALKEMNGGLQEKIKGLEKEPSAAPINVNAKPNGNVIDASGINSSTYTAWRKQMSSIIG